MKTTFAVTLCLLLLLSSACSQKVNDPADVQAIKKSLDDYAQAINAGNADQAAAVWTDKAIYANNHSPVTVGKEAIRSLHTAWNSQVKMEFSCPVEEVRV